MSCGQYSEIPIQPTDQEDLQKLLNAPELAELKTRVRTCVLAQAILRLSGAAIFHCRRFHRY
jgi:hypothetical protein